MAPQIGLLRKGTLRIVRCSTRPARRARRAADRIAHAGRFALLLSIAALVSVGAALAASGSGGSEPPTSLSGVVTNSFGAALEHTLVLLTPVPASQDVRTTTTDRHGRYSFSGLPGATYRVSAIKDGYETTVGQISTWVHRSLDMILVPVGEAREAPSSAGWILSAPKRDILRDLDGSDAMPAGGREMPSRSTGSSILQSIDGEILQSFSEAGSGLSEDSTVTGGNGSTTALAVGSPVGGRLRWNLQGERAREVTSWRDERVQGLESNAQRLKVGLRYDTGGPGRLNMRAFYDHDTLFYEPALSAAVDPFDSDLDRRAWGYDADWSGIVGSDANVQLDLRYLGSAVAGSGATGPRRSANPDDVADELDAETNIWKTSAHISKRMGSNHQVHLGVKARLSSFAGDKDTRVSPSQLSDPSLLTDLGRDGWTVSVNAGESWKILEPVSLDFGFDVSRSMDTSRRLREAVIPQAGVTFTPNPGTSLRGVVSYVAVDHNDDAAFDGGIGREPRGASDTIGLRLRGEQALGRVVTVVIDAESQPFSYESIGARWAPPADEGPAGNILYLSDDAASLREVNLTVQAAPSPRTLLSLGGSAGTVEGQVAAARPDNDFSEVLADRTLRYVVLHLGSRFESTGTDVRLDLTHLDQSEIGAERHPYSDRRIDLRVFQALRFLNVAQTDWSLVLACSSYVPLDGSVQRATAKGPALQAGILRVSGGVAVRF